MDFQKSCPAGAQAAFIGTSSSVNWNKLISVGFIVAAAAIAICAGLFFLAMNRELAVIRAQAEANTRRLEEAREKLAKQEEYLQLLRRDPELVERVIRKKLGYIRGQEFVFRFDEPPALP
jgi:cell division protein FtsB